MVMSCAVYVIRMGTTSSRNVLNAFLKMRFTLLSQHFTIKLSHFPPIHMVVGLYRLRNIFLLVIVFDYFVWIVKNCVLWQYMSFMWQRVLEHCGDPNTQSKVMDEILGAVSMLAQDQYGNYVVQVDNHSWILYFWIRTCCSHCYGSNINYNINFCLVIWAIEFMCLTGCRPTWDGWMR